MAACSHASRSRTLVHLLAMAAVFLQPAVASAQRAESIVPAALALSTPTSANVSPALPQNGAVRPDQRGGVSRAHIRTAKWALLGAAVGMGAYSISHSRAARRSYDALRSTCATEPDRCTIVGSDYADPAMEQRFRAISHDDRRAQVGIIGGQLSLLASATLFILDLRHGRGPGDIPYPQGASSALCASSQSVAALRVPF